MSTITDGSPAAPGQPQPRADRFGAYWAGVGAVLGMELRQRLRSRGWYIMLVIWFVVIGAVTALTWFSWDIQRGHQDNPGFVAPDSGSLIFEIVLAFVLLFALLVAPAFSANAVNGDRAGGTLAILQVTLLRPGQILWGKFLASWVAGLAFLVASVPFLVFAILQGGLGAGHILVALLMLAVEIALVCALGVGISALANRPLFSIVVTYLVVSALLAGTVIAFGLGMLVSDGTVRANQIYYKNSGVYYPNGETPPAMPAPPGNITDQNDEYACYGPLVEQPAQRSDRVAWMLAMNPYVVVADAIPYPDRTGNVSYSTGALESISQGARFAQAGPDATYQCANGRVTASYLGQTTPLWPLGLGLQLLVTAGIVALGRRALRTPAGKLPKGTRVA
ncbi:ABC transporter permease [Specibacter sp. RAF43]|uniref:ABC transporter permease n=1 Tax=Specibacter sp. RAF43 TaxID=3233057 RepID=UPI003F9D0E81